jgi:hypothetical protein
VILALRAGRSDVLVVGSEQLVVKTLVRTRTWRYSDLASAERVVGKVGLYGRTFLVFHLSKGGSYRLTAVNDAPHSPVIIEAAASEVNERISDSAKVT